MKPPVVYTAGLLRRIRRGIDTTDWVWLDSMAGQQLFYPPNVAGWDDTRWLDTATWRGRWWIAQAALDPYALDPEHATQAVRRDEAPQRRARLLARAAAREADAPGAPDVRAPRARRRRRHGLEEAAVPADGRERAPSAHRRLAGVAGRMSGRLRPLRRLVALAAPPQGIRGSGPRAAGDRAGDAAAGRHRADPPPLRHRRPRRRARGVRRLAARASAPSRRESPPRPPGRPRPSSSPSSSRAAPTACLSSRRRATRCIRHCGRRSRSPAAQRLPRTAASSGIRRSTACRRSTRRRRSTSSRPSATRIPTSRTSRRGTTGRSARRTRICGPAGSAATSTRPGQEEQSAAGPVARRHARACARHGDDAGRDDLDARRLQLLLEPRLGRGRAADARGDRAARQPSERRGTGDREQRLEAGRPAAAPAPPVPVVHEPRHSTRSRTTRSRSGLPGSPRCSARGCRSTASR